jgi:hypothetical protein
MLSLYCCNKGIQFAPKNPGLSLKLLSFVRQVRMTIGDVLKPFYTLVARCHGYHQIVDEVSLIAPARKTLYYVGRDGHNRTPKLPPHLCLLKPGQL